MTATAYSLTDRTSVRGTEIRAGLYLRISTDKLDPDDPESRAGVKRQEQDSRALAEARGWHVLDTYEDNDTSAFSRRKTRKNFLRLLSDLDSGTVNALIIWHPDRLARRPRDLEDLIEICERRGVKIATVRAGELDLVTPAGRMIARLLGAVAAHEAEHMQERIKRKHEELALAGKHPGGARRYGYTLDHLKIIPAEAEMIREAARRILGGESIRSVVRDWIAREVPSTRGGRWTPSTLTNVLMSARISGRRGLYPAVDEHDHRPRMDRIVAPAEWPGVISVEDSDALRSLLNDPQRHRRAGASKVGNMLVGLIYCGRCENRMYSAGQHHGYLRCYGPPGHGCGRVSISKAPLRQMIEEAVLRRIDAGALEQILHEHNDDGLQQELAQVQSRMEQLAAKWALEEITSAEWTQARGILEVRSQTLTNILEQQRRVQGLADLPHGVGALRTAWPTLPNVRRRSILALFLTRIMILPAAGQSDFHSRVKPEWKR